MVYRDKPTWKTRLWRFATFCLAAFALCLGIYLVLLIFWGRSGSVRWILGFAVLCAVLLLLPMRSTFRRRRTLFRNAGAIGLLYAAAALGAVHLGQAMYDGLWGSVLKSDGKNIYVSIYADAVDEDWIGFPNIGEFPSSTEYFKALGLSEPKILGATPDFVGATGARTSSRNWNDLEPEHVAWHVVEGITPDTKAGVPCLISANVNVDRLSQLSGPILDFVEGDSPLQRSRIVVVYTGARAELIDTGRKARWEDVLPVDELPDLPVLSP